MIGWIILATAIVFNIVGNYSIKRFSISVQIESLFDYLKPSFIGGMLSFGIALLLYARALKDIPITLAYPMMVGVSMVAISMLAIISLGERFELRSAIGAVFVIVGVAMLSRID